MAARSLTPKEKANEAMAKAKAKVAAVKAENAALEAACGELRVQLAQAAADDDAVRAELSAGQEQLTGAVVQCGDDIAKINAQAKPTRNRVGGFPDPAPARIFLGGVRFSLPKIHIQTSRGRFMPPPIPARLRPALLFERCPNVLRLFSIQNRSYFLIVFCSHLGSILGAI